jgi:putative tryptophan/tyrosine transport system substrate-binding protein
LAALAPDVILANSSAAVGSLLQATRTVPVVFPVVAHPVGVGFNSYSGSARGRGEGKGVYKKLPITGATFSSAVGINP